MAICLPTPSVGADRIEIARGAPSEDALRARRIGVAARHISGPSRRSAARDWLSARPLERGDHLEYGMTATAAEIERRRSWRARQVLHRCHVSGGQVHQDRKSVV